MGENKMSLGHGSKIVSDGLVFAYDMGSIRSWKGKPITNLFYDSGVYLPSVGNLTTAGLSRTTLVSNKKWSITTTTGGNFRWYADLSKLTNGATYTMSYKFTSSYNPTGFFPSDWCDTSVVYKIENKGQYYQASATGTRATYTSTYRFMDFYIPTGAVVEIWDVQLEENTCASEFTSGTRSDTESLLDWRGANTITASSLTYNSDKTFSFRSSGDNVIVADYPYPVSWTQPFSLECWMKVDTGDLWNDPRYVNGHTCVIGRGSYAGSHGITKTSEGVINFLIRTNVGLYPVAVTGVTRDVWHHIVGTWDGTNNKIYLDGVYVTQGTPTWTADTPGQTTWKINGAVAFSGNNGGYGDGHIPVVKMYSKALSADEVKTNFNALRGRYNV